MSKSNSIVHLGGFDPRSRSTLTIKSGDRVDVKAFTEFCFVDRALAAFVPDALREICVAPRIRAGSHLLTGAIYVGAEPGDV